jgi:hypothetical protein
MKREEKAWPVLRLHRLKEPMNRDTHSMTTDPPQAGRPRSDDGVSEYNPLHNMHSMRDLLDRALAWPRRSPGDQPDITDPVKLHFFQISVRLKAEDILTPEEVAARLKAPESWVYEKTRVRCRNPIPCLRLGRYIRFDWNAVITWLTAALEQNAARTTLPGKRKLAH